MAKTKIADFSHHQGYVDWSKAKDELDLAIIRVQYGSGLIDRRYKEYVAGCKQYGIPFGHYAYARFVNVADARQEAKDFLARADDSASFLVVDVEEMTTKSKSDIVPATQAFIDYLHDHGVKKVGLYTGHSFYYSYGMSKVDADFLWIPRYPSNDNGLFYSSEPKMNCDIWQFSQAGKLSGVSGHIDLNILHGSKSLSYFTDKATPAPPKPAPPPPKDPDPPHKFDPPPDLNGKSDYIKLMKNYAGVAGKATNIPFEVCLAQWAWESLWGRSNIAQKTNNFAGIRYTSHADFKYTSSSGSWSGYYTIESFVKDYIRVMNTSYYTAVRNAGSIKATTDALAKSPYSSNDPKYGDNIYGIVTFNKFSSLSLSSITLNKPVPPTPKPPVVPKPVPKPAPKPVPKPAPKPVPKPTPPPKPPVVVTVPKPVVVKDGDTLEDIAKEHGTTSSAIKEANGMTDSSSLPVGKTIQVPVKEEYKEVTGLASNIYGGLMVIGNEVNIHDKPDLNSRIKMTTQSGDKFNVFGMKNGLYMLSGDLFITANETQVKFEKNPNYRVGV